MADGPGFYLYRDEAREFRWSLRAGNNEIIADSAEGYETANGVRAAVGRLIEAVRDSDLHIHDERLRSAG